MTAEWVTAIASIGTFVVIAATAIAALIQLRHMRSSNQIVALNEFRETMASRSFLDAIDFVHKTLPNVLEDPGIRAQIAGGETLDSIKEIVPALTLANFFEQCGIFIKNDIIDREVFCDVWAYVVRTTWKQIAPLVSNVRAANRENAIWENFEYLVSVTKAWERRHPDGAFPRGAAREELPPLWPEVRSKIDRAGG